MSSRVQNRSLQARIVSAEEAAALVPAGATLGTSGFTAAGAPKAVPQALARRAQEACARGERFGVRLLTGASTGPEVDGALGLEGAVDFRFPYQGDPAMRARINAGLIEYQDMHLSHVGPLIRYGYYGKVDFAVVEVAKVREDGSLVLGPAVGASNVYLEVAERVILEVNEGVDERYEGMHDVFGVTGRHGERREIPIYAADTRCGSPYVKLDPARVAAVVLTNAADRSGAFKAPEEVHRRIAGHILDFLEGEVRHGRLPPSLTPIQSGVGNIPNAVLAGLNEGPFEQMTAYTELIQDGMIDMLDSGKLRFASASAVALSPERQARYRRDLDRYRDRIVLRPQEISNSPEVIRRLGCIAMNGFVEADIYGHVNSTHIVGKGIENGIGGSGDFARNSACSIFMSPSTAKGGRISAIVPFASHVDSTEHDVTAVVTEYGLADLRCRSPKQKAREIIERCAHPDYRPLLRDYCRRAWDADEGRHSPHLLDEAFAFHNRYRALGDMRPGLEVRP